MLIQNGIEAFFPTVLSITIAFLPLSSANILIYVSKYSFNNEILFLKKFKPR